VTAASYMREALLARQPSANDWRCADRSRTRYRKRLPLVHQAEAIMEQDPPLLPVAWERINGLV
jgi:hypothetical protein